MPKTKIKKWLKKIITVSLLSVILSLGLTVSTTYASTCQELSGEETKPGVCEIQNVNSECPTGDYTKAVKEDRVICTKTVKSQESTKEEVAQANFLAGLQKALNRLIWPILVLIGGLMDNGLLFGNGMEQTLQDIWIPIRNLVNILFVIVLVGIALYNVLGIGDESGNYSIKSALPKIIIALIAVNFSFLAIKVFLDAINVLTSSVFNLPGQVSEGLATVVKPNTDRDKEMIGRLCASLKDMTVQQMSSKSDEFLSQQQANAIAISIAADPQFGLTGVGVNVASMSFDEIKAKIQEVNGDQGVAKVEAFQNKFNSASEGQICIGSKLSGQGEAFLTRWNSRNAAFAMALSMAKMVYYQDVHPESLKDVQKLAINTLFSFFMYLIFTISFLALFVVLLARLVVMWLSIALSPVLILILAAPTLKEKMGGFNKIAENFVKLAIAPLIIALSMTIGWIMLNAIRGLDAFSKTSALSIDPSQGIPVVGLSSIQDLTVAVGTIAIIWLGVFGAAEGTIAEKATGFMKDNFQKFGTYIGTMPFKHAPLIPITLPGGKEGKYSAGEALYAAQEFARKATDTTQLARDLGIHTGTGLDDLDDKTRVSTPLGIAQWMHSNKDRLQKDEYVQKLQELYKRGETKEGVKLTEPQKTAIKNYLDSPDKTNADLNNLLEAEGIKEGYKGLPPAGSTRPGATPPAAPAAAVAQVRTDGKIQKSDGSLEDAKVGGETVQGLYGFGADGRTLAGEGPTQIGIFNNSLRTLATATEKTAVIKAAKDLHLKRTGGAAVAPTLAELETLLGKPKYDEIVKAAGGAKALEKALKDGTTAAAATPAAPAAGTAPAGPPAAEPPPLPAGGTDPLGDADAGTGPPPGP